MFIIIIQARMGSTRLPGKIMKKILGKEIILWSYDRSVKSIADDIYIATSINKENDILENFFIYKKIKYFRGSENDLLDRYYKLCLHNNLNKDDVNIIRITSDCPFVDTDIINDMINFYKENNYDYIINHSKEGITPEGSGIEIINFKSLEYLWKNSNDPNFREHATGLLSKTTLFDNAIKKGVFIYTKDDINKELVGNEKVSIDTISEYNKAIKIAEQFNNFDFSYHQVLKYLESTKTI
jgi:spore coat polysaccharide biosynthesis protein SpsF